MLGKGKGGDGGGGGGGGGEGEGPHKGKPAFIRLHSSQFCVRPLLTSPPSQGTGIYITQHHSLGTLSLDHLGLKLTPLPRK